MYTNVYQRGKYMCVRGVENGQRVEEKVEFFPTIWVSGKLKEATDPWKTLDGRTVYAFQPGTMPECRDFKKMYDGVSGFELYESPGHVYQYIAENHPGEIRFDPQDIRVYTIDIETETENGFPDPRYANEQILLITVKDTNHNQIITWGLHSFDNDLDHVEYRWFNSERDLLKNFVLWWSNNYPDVVTGWNSRFFDLPYLYNRISRIHDETAAKRLSPWNVCDLREVQQFSTHDKTRLKLSIAGIADLDYIELYRKFTYSAQESYKLDYIAWVELGENKLKNPTGGSFKSFYSGEFDVDVQPKEDDTDIRKKAYKRTMMKNELIRRGLLPNS